MDYETTEDGAFIMEMTARPLIPPGVFDRYADAEKVVKLEGHQARRVADLRLHEGDLNFALSCLNELRGFAAKPESVRARAFWTSALVHYFKCFGDSKSRSQIDAGKVHKGKPDREAALDAHRHLLAIRDKHVVHDENSYSGCITGAVLEHPDKTPKVREIVTLHKSTNLVNQDNFGNLELLVKAALAWVNAYIRTLSLELMAELETRTHDELLGLDDARWWPPPTEDRVDGPRKR